MLFLQFKTPNQIRLYAYIICTAIILGVVFYVFKKSFRTNINNYVKNHVFFLFIFLSFYVIYLVSRLFFVDSFFNVLFDEDGVFEYLTMLFFLLASVFFISSLSKRKSLFINIFISALAISCFFVGMEEISWGQRVFGIETPNSFKDLNYQGETTVHNLIDPNYHTTIYLVISVFCLIFFSFTNISKFDSLFWVHKDYLPSRKFLVIALLLPFISLYNMEHFEVILSFLFCVYAFQLNKKLYNKIYLN